MLVSYYLNKIRLISVPTLYSIPLYVSAFDLAKNEIMKLIDLNIIVIEFINMLYALSPNLN